MKRSLVLVLVALFLPLQVAFMPGTPWVIHAQATISLSPASVQPAAALTVQGSGFSARYPYTISINTPTSASVTAVADSNGNLTATVTVPGSTPPGTYTVTVANGSQVLAQAQFQVSAVQVSATPNPAPAGSAVSVQGAGFAPGSNVTVHVTVTLSGGATQSVDVPITVTATGAFTATLTIPGNTAPASYTVHVYQAGTTVDIAQLTLAVTNPTAITLSPATLQGGADTTISVSGTQFGSNEYVQVTYTASLATGTGVTEQATGQTDANGSFTVYSLPVPGNIVAGTYTITATGQTSGRTATATLTVSTQPALKVSPASAPPGATVTVTGSGFAKNTPVNVTYQFPLTGAAATPAAGSPTPTADNGGSFTLQITVPAGAQPATVAIQASQKLGNSTLTASATITVLPPGTTLQVSPTSASAGSSVTVTGHGFVPGPNAPVSISAPFQQNGTSQTVTQTVDVDSSGSFSATLAVPNNASAGTITVTATQPSSGDSATAQLTVLAASTTGTPLPTSTPTSTPTTSPTPTNTPVTPVVSAITPTPPKRPSGALRFSSASLLHSAVYVLATDRVDLRANTGSKLLIKVIVVFPSGSHLDYRGLTDGNGRWSKLFTVPKNAVGPYSDRAYIMAQIWSGTATAKTFLSFKVMR